MICYFYFFSDEKSVFSVRGKKGEFANVEGNSVTVD